MSHILKFVLENCASGGLPVINLAAILLDDVEKLFAIEIYSSQIRALRYIVTQFCDSFFHLFAGALVRSNE